MQTKLSLITLACLFLGALSGFFLQEQILAIEVLGTIYLDALKLLVFPVIVVYVISAVYESGSNKGALVWKAVLLFAVLFVVSFLISSGIVFVLNPADHFELHASETTVEATSFSASSILLNVLPKDLAGFFMGRYLLFSILVSYAVGFLAYRFKWDTFIAGINWLKKYINLILKALMYYAPVAVFSLMGVSVFRFGADVLLSGLAYIFVAYLAGLVVLALVMILPVKLFKGISLLGYVKKLYPVWLISFSTCSSAATMPYTLKVCKDDLQVNPHVADIVVPLGCTIHMCGGAISFSLLGIFCAHFFGVAIDPLLYATMLASALFINMAAPGIPGGGIIIGATYLQGLGIPLDFMGFYSGIYKVLDMLYTTLNVTGDISACTLLDKGASL